VDFQSAAVIGVQTHLFWHHPERGITPAEEFIEVARQAQLLFPIELWMLQTSCRVAKAWRTTTGRGFVIGNKVSGTFLRRSEAVPAIERVLAESQLEPRLLEIQLAAHDFVGEIDAIERAIGRLRELGVRFAVTDFGAESTSLAQLKRLKIERLRIAPSLVRNVVSDTDSAAICGSIVALARALGLSTLAEGVESAVQYELLRQLGCNAFQGPHFRAELGAQEVRTLLAEMGEHAAIS
jgi:EAL domain-containing protein (putative c-di-GMP-specific phosphodiesterase class I)